MLLALPFALTTAASPTVQEEKYREVHNSPRRMRLRMSTTITCADDAPDHWILLSPCGANLPSARVLSAKSSVALKQGSVNAIVAKDAAGKSYFRTEFAARDLTDPRSATIVTELVVELMRSRVATGRPDSPPAPPEGEELAEALSPSEHADFKSTRFQSWLDVYNLRRGPDEGVAAFAERVANALSKSARWANVGTFPASATIASGKSDCGGLAAIAVAAFRANGIPARFLSGGILLKPGTADPGKEENWKNFSTHASAEFWHPVAGWLAFDGSNCAARGAAALGERPPGFFALAIGGPWTIQTPKGLTAKPWEFFQIPHFYLSGPRPVGKITSSRVWELTAE